VTPNRGGWEFWGAVAGRIAEATLMLAMAVLFSFVVSRLIPGDPVALMADGQGGDPEFVRRLRQAAGVDLPVWQQFFTYGMDVLHGNLGMSWRYGGVPVATLILDAAPITFPLVIVTMIVAIPLGIGVGALSAHRARAGFDIAATIGAMVVLSIPPVVLATWLMLGATAFFGQSASGELASFADWVVPITALVMAPAALIARTTRAQVLDVMGQDYVRYARAKGLTETAIFFHHVLPNVMVAVWAIVGILAGAVLTSTAVVEIVFDLPGLGQLAIFSVLSRDYSLAGVIILIFVVFQVVISLICDLAIISLDPRTRHPQDRP